MRRFALTILAMALLVTACGDEPRGPREVDAPEYAQILVSADILFWRDFNESTLDWARVGADTVSAERVFLTFALLAGRYSDTLFLAIPPEALLRSHEAYLTALRELALAFSEASIGRSAISFADVFEADPDLATEFDAANERARDGCVDLQSSLGELGQSVTLRCSSFF